MHRGQRTNCNSTTNCLNIRSAVVILGRTLLLRPDRARLATIFILADVAHRRLGPIVELASDTSCK